MLTDGRVLVAGGGSERASLVYDPARDTWTALGALGEPRSEHTLTMLADGRVLAVGGSTTPSSTGHGRLAQSAEIFDPRTGAWSAAGTLRQARLRHAATLMRDGRVLVSGGSARPGEPGGQLASTEIFDPRTQSWRDGPPLAHPRQLHTATSLIDGRVIVIGGQIWAERMEAVPEVELLDVTHSGWRLGAPIPEPRSGHTTTALADGRLLVVGGWNRDHGRTSTVELYDVAHDRWIEAAELSMGRDQHASVLLRDGRIVVLGGQTNGSLLRGLREGIAEIYDLRTDRWMRSRHPPAPRMEHSMLVLVDGRVLVFGGVDSHYDPPLTRVEIGRCR